MATVLKQVLAWMPFFFGIGFIAPLIAQLMEILGAEKVKKLGNEYYLFQTESPERIRDSSAARFICI